METAGKRGMRRGYLYTISIVLFMVPLILLILFYTGVSRTTIENTVAGVRCDELYYFVQDIESDMERAMLISGRRAAIYAIDDVVTNGAPLENYTYTNCTEFVYPRDGAEAAIAELILCGTLYGENSTYMVEHTLPVWLEKINNGSLGLHYVVNMSVTGFDIAMYDAWDFAIVIDMNFSIHDETGLCYYMDDNFTIQSLTDIIGLEDPLYPLNTNNRAKKYIYNCSLNITIDNLAGCSKDDSGEGIGPGKVAFVSEIGVSNLASFCADPSAYGYDYDVGEIILVFDQGIGACNQLPESCVDNTSNNHLAGIIDMGPNSPLKLTDHCNVTIPWIADTGKMDNVTGHGGGWPPGCPDDRSDITSRGTCVVIKNVEDCGIHQVILGYDASDLNTTCYTVSDVARYNLSCPGEAYPNGPSFFDRLDGRLYLADKYKDRSLELFGTGDIGIETLVSPYDLDLRGVTVFENATWADYLYWSDTPGSPVTVMCQDPDYYFRLDCPHAYFYNLGTQANPASSEPPESSIDEPADGTSYTNCPDIMINGTADDCDGEVSYVDILIDGVAYRADFAGPGWNYTFSPADSDIYVLQSRATDDSLVTEADLEDLVIFVSGCSGGDNDPPPAPALVGPCGETGLPTTVTLDWEAPSDPSGIYQYDIELNRTSSPQSSTRYYSFTTTQEVSLNNNKDYIWRVRAQDNAGNWGEWSSTCGFST